jgi:hypothetical protein
MRIASGVSPHLRLLTPVYEEVVHDHLLVFDGKKYFAIGHRHEAEALLCHAFHFAAALLGVVLQPMQFMEDFHPKPLCSNQAYFLGVAYYVLKSGLCIKGNEQFVLGCHDAAKVSGGTAYTGNRAWRKHGSRRPEHPSC